MQVSVNPSEIFKLKICKKDDTIFERNIFWGQRYNVGFWKGVVYKNNKKDRHVVRPRKEGPE